MASKAAPIAWKGVQEAIKPLQADLFVLRGRTRSKRNPSDWEFHANPLALGIAAVGAGLTLWLLQLNVRKRVTEVIDSKILEFDVNVSDYKGSIEAYVPDGYTMDKTIPVGHTYLENSTGAALAYIGAGLIGSYLYPKIIDVVDVDVKLPRIGEVTPKYVHHAAEGYWESVPAEAAGSLSPHGYAAGTMVQVFRETKAAYDELVGYHIKVKVYQIEPQVKTLWHIDERKGLSIGTLV